jgi:hypothetical protein
MQLGVLFPLTLTLSLREREQLSTAAEYSLNGKHLPALPVALPLPKGEGWGEGERVFQMNRAG